MSNSFEAARNQLSRTIDRIQGAYAPSTLRAYRSDFAEFIGFCETQGLEVFPPNPLTLADFIAHISDKDRSSASIRRAIAGISTIYRLNRMPDPNKDPEVVIAMKRMHRKLGRAANQAQGITSELLDKLLAAIDYSPRGIRNRALLLIAYDTLCRRSELVSLQIQDIRTVEKDGTGHTAILLRRSKTDQESSGRWLHLSERSQTALKAWLDILPSNEGPIFRRINQRMENINPLAASQVNRIFKRIAQNAKIDENLIKRISGHSCRVGAAQDLVNSGASLPIIMSKGRWTKTDTVMRYVEHIRYAA
jgi:site-specific recombinase XerD